MADTSSQNRREVDVELDVLEGRISELKMLYEQYFVGVLTQSPDKLHGDVKRQIRQLLKAPFKQATSKFRLRSLIQRYQTYNTYWERVKKEKDEGTYSKDLFKAELRQRSEEELQRERSNTGKAEKGLQQLYGSYEEAVKKSGGNADNLNYNAFRKSILSKAKELRKKHGVKKLHYKIVVKEGKVVVKASAKD